MIDYTTRKAEERDIPFLAKAIIQAEKGGTNKLAFSTLFNLSENEVNVLIQDMLKEEIEYCEFSLSSFLIVEENSEPIATFGGWIEQFGKNKPSQLLKSNLVSFSFNLESLTYFKNRSHLIEDFSVEREKNALQLEYAFVSKNHRGKQLLDKLISKHETEARTLYPDLRKVQVQVFKNNYGAIKVYLRNGFKIAKSYISKHRESLQYLPHNEKYLMEKEINK